MKKNFLLLSILLLNLFIANAQNNKIKGKLSTLDTAELSILNIYPESFPEVSVVFKAQKINGEPLWSLTADDMIVHENTDECEVLSLEQISKNKSINLGIVIDHSGSMIKDFSQLFDENGKPRFSFGKNGKFILPDDYVAPIDNAKAAVKDFVSSFNFSKDLISIIGFSNRVDRVLPLTQDTSAIRAIIDSMKADYNTALYNAIDTGINMLIQSDGIKVIIALTDGWDNASISTPQSIIDKAKKNDIPIYLIGLGEVNKDTLGYISNSTKGQFYHVKSSNSLKDIYGLISKQVQAFYSLTYVSENISSVDTARKLELRFDIDSLYLSSTPESFDIPKEVLVHVEEKEKQRTYMLWGGIFLALLIGGGTILLTRKPFLSRPSISKIYPNPSKGRINIETKTEKGTVHITDMTGKTVKTVEFSEGRISVDISDLPDGNYITNVESNGSRSSGSQISLQK
ncbi:MAG TPA: VWA domain-containing protein [Bacteroidetes bacterium]|nr:VWA domain-containing protein [Bacteroidota bacterium]